MRLKQTVDWRQQADGTHARVPVYFIDDREVTEAEYRAACGEPRLRLAEGGEPLLGQATTGWPLVSEALAVHPDQVAEANERNRRHGVNVKYDPATGCAVIPDRAERGRLLKLEGYVDKRSFTGN